MTDELPDTVEGLEAKNTAKRLPAGFRALYFGLVVWGLYYLWARSPWGSGWTQAGALEAGAPTAARNIGNTVAFTLIPAIVLLVLAVAMARGKRRP